MYLLSYCNFLYHWCMHQKDTKITTKKNRSKRKKALKRSTKDTSFHHAIYWQQEHFCDDLFLWFPSGPDWLANNKHLGIDSISEIAEKTVNLVEQKNTTVCCIICDNCGTAAYAPASHPGCCTTRGDTSSIYFLHRHSDLIWAVPIYQDSHHYLTKLWW